MSTPRRRTSRERPGQGPHDAERSRDCDSLPAEALCHLDAIELRLLECRAVLGRLEKQLHMTFGDLALSLSVGERLARQAFRAVSLLRQGAALDPAIVDTVSGPGSIFARHQAAVSHGASPVLPGLTSAEDLRLAIRLAAGFGLDNQTHDAHPQCEAIARNTGLQCKKRVIAMGPGEFSSRCYSHSNEEVRRGRQKRVVAESESMLVGKVHDNIGQGVVEEWLTENRPLPALSILPTDWPLIAYPAARRDNIGESEGGILSASMRPAKVGWRQTPTVNSPQRVASRGL